MFPTRHHRHRSQSEVGFAAALVRGLTRCDIVFCLLPIGFFVSMLSLV